MDTIPSERSLEWPAKDLDALINESVETRFGSNQSLTEGVSGLLSIDTTFENTVETTLNVVRSDVTRYQDRPAPHDTKRWAYPHRRA